MQQVFLGIGGNLGDVLGTIRRTAASICALSGVQEVRFSRLYRTTPVSDLPQPDYLNCVCSLFTSLTPLLLLEKLQSIERVCGKKEKPKNAARAIDIDILLYGDEVVDGERLIIPHPRWRERLFVLVPLAEFIERVGPCVLRTQIQKLRALNQEHIEVLSEEIDAKSTVHCGCKKFLDW
jgi:2-amino-4-hydroxy-6-hydroxymethyldihydropteridine diphosphokinase